MTTDLQRHSPGIRQALPLVIILGEVAVPYRL